MSEQTEKARIALAIAQDAADVVMRVYAQPFAVEYKGENDPVTRGDREANELIVERLTREFPGATIVAEESDPLLYSGFAASSDVWFVDPLDGTREFVARNGEFAVMIGLAQRGKATMGVIVAPAWRRSFFGVVGEGAWEVLPGGELLPIHVSPRSTSAGAVVAISRSRSSGSIAAVLAGMAMAAPVRHGSSGLKGVLVAVGQCDAYVQPGVAGMRWDACATDALVRAAGGACTDAHGDPFDYACGDLLNSKGLLASNGHLHGVMLGAVRARDDLAL
jgi:3'(2'), 5'-bisphosphate nucleotidase